MSLNQRSWMWLWVMFALFVGALAREAWIFVTFDDRVPVVFDRVEVLNSPVKSGENLVVRIWREKVREDCPVLSQRLAVNQDGVVFDLPDSAWRGGPAGTPYLDYAYPTVESMPPGNYLLRVHLTYTCPNLVFNIDQPTTPFRIHNNECPAVNRCQEG
jgi:hypothetical protein